MLRKFIVYCLSFIVLALFASPALAQAPIPSYVPPTSPLYTDLLVHNMFHTFSCLAVGQSVIGQPCLTYQITKNAQGTIQSVPVLSQVNLSGGTLGTVTSVIGMLYQNPPVRTGDYLASVGQSFGIVKEAHAQVVGSGEGVLHPILTLWQVSRNIAYLIMIIIFVIIGLMVMFRNRINPQTVITAQAALPGLVIGLILITFSYFLAGLITDTAFIGTNLVGYYFQAAQADTGKPPPANRDLNQNLTEVISHENVLTVFSKFIGIIETGDIQQAIQLILDSSGTQAQIFLRFLAGVAAFQVGSQVGHIVPIVGDLASIATGVIAFGAAASATAPILGFVLSGVAMVILIYAMLRLLLKLLTTYLNIIFLTLIAPFQFLFASLPGRQGIATSWVLNMLANVLAFPAVLAVFYFVAFLIGKPLEALDLFNIKSPVANAANTALPLLGKLPLSFIRALIAFGALIATPAIPDIISRSIGRPGQAGGLLEQAIGGNIRAGQGYATQAQQQGFGAINTVGQNYQSFRGRPPQWSPAAAAQTRGIVLPGWLRPRG